MSSPRITQKFAALQKQYDISVHCNRCGFCETACPTYVATGKETFSPRGRVQALRGIFEGKITDPQAASEVFSTCLTCFACTNVCFSEVPVGDLMGYARETACGTILRPIGTFFLRFFLVHRKILSLFLWTAFFFKRLGVSFVLNKTGLLKVLSPELSAGEEIAGKVPLIFGANVNKKPPRINAEKKDLKVAYFSGCGMHYLYPGSAGSCLKLLEDNVREVAGINHSCCGLAAFTAGDPEGAKMLARKTLAQFAQTGADYIVTDDDSCCGFLLDYPKLLDNAPQALEFSAKVKNLSDFLVENGIAPAVTQSGRITYHDPCRMGNGQKSTANPRIILRNIPSVDFVELEEANWCCGGAGAYCLKHKELSDLVLERKLANIRETKADKVITQAASCLLHIGYGIRKKGWEKEIEVVHIADFLNDRE